MTDEETKMMKKIMNSGRLGYAYLYPVGGGERQEFFISTTARNVANFFKKYFHDVEKMVITDILDRLILDTGEGAVNMSRDWMMSETLNPAKGVTLEDGEVLLVPRNASEEYFKVEDEQVTIAEYGSML